LDVRRSVAEHARERDVEPGEERRREDVVCLPRELDRPAEAVAVAAVDADDVDLGVDDPVLADAELLIPSSIDRLVALAAT
jgi:hypothetical protein